MIHCSCLLYELLFPLSPFLSLLQRTVAEVAEVVEEEMWAEVAVVVEEEMWAEVAVVVEEEMWAEVAVVVEEEMWAEVAVVVEEEMWAEVAVVVVVVVLDLFYTVMLVIIFLFIISNLCYYSYYVQLVLWLLVLSYYFDCGGNLPVLPTLVGPSSSSLSESALGRGKLGSASISSSHPESSRSLNDDSNRSIASCVVCVAIVYYAKISKE